MLAVSKVLSKVEVFHELKDESKWMLQSGVNPDEWYHIVVGETSVYQRFVAEPLSVGY